MINDWRKLKLKFRLVGLQLSRLTLDKVYPRDPNPEHWRTINGSKVHWRKLKLKFRLVGLQLSRLTLDKVYPRDPNPEHWRTINGSKVHLTNGKIDGGVGGKFSGNTWTGTRKGGMRGSTALPKYIGPKTAPEQGSLFLPGGKVFTSTEK